jgi:hypothetical protein
MVVILINVPLGELIATPLAANAAVRPIKATATRSIMDENS